MEKNKIEAAFSSDAKKEPRRIVFVTKKTSAKVVGERGPQLMAYPHLLAREAIAFQVLVIAMVIAALFWDAPLEQLANPLLTPNPAKAPWYFLGLQELLHFFPPFVAGILIPTLVVIALIVIPYFNVNVEGEPLWAQEPKKRLRAVLAAVAALLILLALFDISGCSDCRFRGLFGSYASLKVTLEALIEAYAWTIVVPTLLVVALLVFAYTAGQKEKGWLKTISTKPLSWWVMTWFIAVAICLTVVGTFFRGPGWSWVWPWRIHAG